MAGTTKEGKTLVSENFNQRGIFMPIGYVCHRCSKM